MKIGPYEILPVDTGRFRLDGGAMFGSVPKVLWEKTNPADDKNRIELALRAFCIRGEGRCFLVDSGMGYRWSEKHVKIFGIDNSRYNLEDSLGKISLSRSDITDVVITHLHFDHVGGTTQLNEKGETCLTFPNATIWVQEENLKHAHAPTPKDRASYLQDYIQPLIESEKLKAIEGEVELAPGIFTWPSHGHTRGQHLLRVTGDEQTLIVCGDMIPTASHIPIPYVMGYDLYPVTTMEEKEVLLKQAVRENWVLAFVHDPFIEACTVSFNEGRYSRHQAVEL